MKRLIFIVTFLCIVMPTMAYDLETPLGNLENAKGVIENPDGSIFASYVGKYTYGDRNRDVILRGVNLTLRPDGNVSLDKAVAIDINSQNNKYQVKQVHRLNSGWAGCFNAEEVYDAKFSINNGVFEIRTKMPFTINYAFRKDMQYTPLNANSYLSMNLGSSCVRPTYDIENGRLQVGEQEIKARNTTTVIMSRKGGIACVDSPEDPLSFVKKFFGFGCKGRAKVFSTRTL